MEQNDRTRRAHQHRKIAARRVRTFPVQSANHTNERARQVNCAGDIQVKVNRTRRGIVQAPEHQEQTNKKVRKTIDEDLFARTERRLAHLFADREDDVLGNHGAPAEQVGTVDRHRRRQHARNHNALDARAKNVRQHRRHGVYGRKCLPIDDRQWNSVAECAHAEHC